MDFAIALLRRGLGLWINYLSYYFGGPSPFPVGYVLLELTRRCNLRCVMCNIPQSVPDFKTEKEEELDSCSWTETVSSSRFLKMMPKISLTGGEPFLREDIGELVSQFVKMRHVQQVCIVSNGSLPERIVPLVGHILEACPRGKILEVAISLDGLGDLHDAIRGTQGLFARVRRTLLGLCYLRERYPQLEIICNTVLQPLNIDSVENLVEFLNAHRIKASCGVIQNNAFLRNQDARYGAKEFSEEQLAKVIAIARREEKLIGTHRYVATGARPLPCYAGFNSVFISSKGLVYPCVSMAHNPKFVLGDSREGGFDAVWSSAQAWQVRQMVQSCNECWNVCELRATRLQHLIWEWGIKFASLGFLDYYELRGMR